MHRPLHVAFLPLRRRPVSPRRSLRPAAPLPFAAAATTIWVAGGSARAAEAVAGPVAPPSLLDIVSHTPFWVWLVLVGLVWLGLRRTRPREIGLSGLLLFPIVLALLSLSSLLTGGLALSSLAGLGLGGLLGIAAGLWLERRYPARPLGNGRLQLAGEWTSLIVVLSVFLVHYVQAVTGVVDPSLAAADGFAIAMAGISGFFSLMLITRTLLRLRLALSRAALVQG